MKCPKCGGESGVIDSRPYKSYVKRRHLCFDCNDRFTTYEIYADEYKAHIHFMKTFKHVQKLFDIIYKELNDD